MLAAKVCTNRFRIAVFREGAVAARGNGKIVNPVAAILLGEEPPTEGPGRGRSLSAKERARRCAENRNADRRKILPAKRLVKG
uniref:hypothetical protein n=1 Tax=uncultured Sphingomonas sp. TaxID=158754 RepID=UPI0035CB8F70